MALAKHPGTYSCMSIILWHELQMIKVLHELNKEFYETIKDEPYAKM